LAPWKTESSRYCEAVSFPPVGAVDANIGADE
jgi:hypothetical protein